MSSIYINNITEIIGLFKASFQVSLNLINLDLQKIAKTKEKESIDDLLNNLYNKNISTMNIFPNKYKLKLLNTLNNNNDNIFSMSSFDEDINEKAEDNKEDLSEINLSIIKVMYKNFTLLSSHKVDIQLEEEKLYTTKLSTKLFSNITAFNTNKINTFTKEMLFDEKDKNKLDNLTDKTPNRLVFLKKLNKFRSQSRFQLTINFFLIIGKLLNKFLSFFENEKDSDYNIVKNCIILSQTYYYLDENEKIYLKTYIEEHSIFKKPKFWENLLNFLIKNEMDNKNYINKDGYVNIVFGIIYTFIDTMFEFKLNIDEINKIIQPKIEMYNLTNNYKEDIDNLIKQKLECNNTLLSEGKKMYKLMEIINKHENESQNNEFINKDKKLIISNKDNGNLELDREKINNN